MTVRTRVGRGICMAMALSTMLAAHSVVEAAPGLDAQAKFPRTSDVSLQANGDLRGQILDQQGQPQALTKVALLQNQKTIGHATTDITGQFVIRGLRPGAYQVQTEDGGQPVRLWAAQTAPPAAQQTVLLITSSDIARAQGGGIGFDTYGPALRGAVAGGLLTGLTYWAIDHNPSGS